MPSNAAHTLFGQPELKVSPAVLSHLAFICSAECPRELPNIVGDFAVIEVCVPLDEVADMRSYHEALRSDGQLLLVRKVRRALEAEAARGRKPGMADVGKAIEGEFDTLDHTYFLRMRAYEVMKLSTNEMVGRFVSFPDQVSDDYASNMQEIGESGHPDNMVQRMRVLENLPTVFIGHGKGAALAILCAIATGRQAVIFDSSLLSLMLARNAMTHKVVTPKDPEDKAATFTALFYRTEATAHKQDQVEEIARDTIRNVLGNDRGSSTKWLDKAVWSSIKAIIPPAASHRFAISGRYNARSISDILATFTTTVHITETPYSW